MAGGSLGAVLTTDGLLKALGPVLAGVALLGALAWAEDRVPEVPGGDIIALGRRALRLAAPLGPMLARAENALRAWPAWAADPLHADPTGVFRALAASHDFDNLHSSWAWNPDRRVYERPASFEPETQPESEEPTDAQD